MLRSWVLLRSQEMLNMPRDGPKLGAEAQQNEETVKER